MASSRREEARPRLDAYLSDPQKAEILGDCYQLLLILAETEAQSASGREAIRKGTVPDVGPWIFSNRPGGSARRPGLFICGGRAT